MAETTMPNVNPPTVPKLNVKQTFLIGLGFCSCMLAWGMYNFYMPRILAGHYINDVPFRVGFFTGTTRILMTDLIMTFDNIFAIFLQPFFGELSDKLQSKYGRRTPFLIIGIPIAAVSLFLMPFVVYLSAFWVVFLSFITIVILFNLAMAFYRAPVVALMPDLTPSVHRSMANVIINIMGGIGTAVGFLIPPIMGGLAIVKNNITGYTTFEAQNFVALDLAIFWSTAIFILIVLGLYLLLVREVPTGQSFWKVGTQRIEIDPETGKFMPAKEDKKKIKYNTGVEIKAIFNKKDKSAAFAFLAIFLWSASDDAFSTNMSVWGTEYVSFSDSMISTLSIVMMVFVLILGIPGAKLSTKKGRLWTMRTGLILLIISYAGLILFEQLIRGGFKELGFYGIMFCIGLKAGGGGFLGIAAITIIWQMSPKDKIGSYTGLYYLFKQTGSVVAPLLAGGFHSLLSLVVDTTAAWIVLNPLCLVLAILGYIAMVKVHRGEVGDELSPEEIAELEEQYGD